MEKHKEAAVLGYFIVLSMLVFCSLNIDIIDLVYVVVVICCSLKFILIVNKSKN